MLTLGSIPRQTAAAHFPFLAERVRHRRAAIRDFTHADPELVFWIAPDGRFHDARDAHRQNPPKGYAHIIDDPPDYGGFLRGRVARNPTGHQLVVVYCREEALATDPEKLRQFARGVANLPIPLDPTALVISDNADIYGTLTEVLARAAT